MNTIERIRKGLHNKIREKKFARKSGTPNFRLIPGWILAKISRDDCFYSQCGQDWFLATYIFPGQTNGTFVDVGANHPTEINNTLYFEMLGWTGIAFEPQATLCELWKQQRKTTCFPYVLGAEKKKVSFHLDEVHTFSSVVDAEENSTTQKNCLILEQRRLDQVLLEHNYHHIDYLSIDVEGYEKDVLAGLDLSEFTINCVVIENNPTRFGDNSLRTHMQSNGYRYIARLCGDDVFVKTGSNAESNYLHSDYV